MTANKRDRESMLSTGASQKEAINQDVHVHASGHTAAAGLNVNFPTV